MSGSYYHHCEMETNLISILMVKLYRHDVKSLEFPFRNKTIDVSSTLNGALYLRHSVHYTSTQ